MLTHQVHSDAIRNSPKAHTNQVSSSRLMDKKTVVYMHNGISPAMEKDDGLIYATTDVLLTPGSQTGTGLWPVRKHATQQEVSGR